MINWIAYMLNKEEGQTIPSWAVVLLIIVVVFAVIVLIGGSCTIGDESITAG